MVVGLEEPPQQQQQEQQQQQQQQQQQRQRHQQQTMAMFGICMHHLSVAMPLCVGGIAAKRCQHCR